VCLLSLEALGENMFLASSSSLWLPAYLGLWPHHFRSDLCGHNTFSSFVVKSPSASLLERHLRLYLEPTSVIRVYFPISVALILLHMQKFPFLPYAVTYTNCKNLGMPVFGGIIIQAATPFLKRSDT